MDALIATLLNWVEVATLSVISLLMLVVLYYKQHHGKLFRIVYSGFIIMVMAWVFVLVIQQPPTRPRLDDLIRPIACLFWMGATLIRVTHLYRQAKSDEVEHTALYGAAEARLFSLTFQKLQKYAALGLVSVLLIGLLIARINRVELLQFTAIAASQQTKTVVAQANQRISAVEQKIGDDTAVNQVLSNQKELEKKLDRLAPFIREPSSKTLVKVSRPRQIKPLPSKPIVLPPVSNTIVPAVPDVAPETKKKRWYWPPDWFSARADSTNQLVLDY